MRPSLSRGVRQEGDKGSCLRGWSRVYTAQELRGGSWALGPVSLEQAAMRDMLLLHRKGYGPLAKPAAGPLITCTSG
jgi:hypothetical protein